LIVWFFESLSFCSFADECLLTVLSTVDVPLLASARMFPLRGSGTLVVLARLFLGENRSWHRTRRVQLPRWLSYYTRIRLVIRDRVSYLARSCRTFWDTVLTIDWLVPFDRLFSSEKLLTISVERREDSSERHRTWMWTSRSDRILYSEASRIIFRFLAEMFERVRRSWLELRERWNELFSWTDSRRLILVCFSSTLVARWWSSLRLRLMARRRLRGVVAGRSVCVFWICFVDSRHSRWRILESFLSSWVSTSFERLVSLFLRVLSVVRSSSRDVVVGF
jgi:hypothetical protein